MENRKLKIENLPPGRTTSYPCVNHNNRDAWVRVGDTLLCRECYTDLRRPKTEN